ncbi:hypothetical protein [Schaalia sp. ZJ1691]|uniref:hypothetical protein n=1 Tax=Schaalia sp. ZJ1691 TaxID=2709404 RepID=UPI0013EC50E2|nr:hypothetical protein [Schaalia sp. ZJ1691]
MSDHEFDDRNASPDTQNTDDLSTPTEDAVVETTPEPHTDTDSHLEEGAQTGGETPREPADDALDEAEHTPEDAASSSSMASDAQTPAQPSEDTENPASTQMWAAARDRTRVLTGEEVELPGEETDVEDIVGEAHTLKTSQIEPVTIGAHTTTIPVISESDDSDADSTDAPEILPNADASSSPQTLQSDDTTASSTKHPSLLWAATTEDSTPEPTTEPDNTETAHTGAAPGLTNDTHDTSAQTAHPEDTTIRRRSLMTAADDIEETQEAAWKPRDGAQERAILQSTPGSLDDAIFSGATVVAEVPSRAGAHWLSFFAFLLLSPVAWYLLGDAGARMTLLDNSPMNTGALNFLALGELVGALVVVLLLFVLGRRSSLGAWISGVLWTIAGIPWIVIPALTATTLNPLLTRMFAASSFTGNIAHHLQASGYSGRMLFLGLALIGLGYVSHSARRVGRSEEVLRAEVEKVNPVGAYFTRRERRRAEKQAGLR